MYLQDPSASSEGIPNGGFGVDPVFLLNSDMYDSNVEMGMHPYWNFLGHILPNCL